MGVRTDWGTEYAADARTVPAATKHVPVLAGSPGRGSLMRYEL